MPLAILMCVLPWQPGLILSLAGIVAGHFLNRRDARAAMTVTSFATSARDNR